MNLRSRWNLRGVSGTTGTIEGDFAKIMANLNREILLIKERTTKGLLLAAIDIRRSMNDTPPLIPIDYGNLRHSFFITTKKGRNYKLAQYEVKDAHFRNAETPAILAKLRTGHQEVLQQAQEELASHDIGVMLGFSAFYAAPVHEMVGEVNWGRGNPTKNSGIGAKFFQAAVYRNFDKIIYTVKANAQIRP